MNPLNFLKAAYIVAWVVYLGYLIRILLRMRLVEAERKEMERGSSSATAARQSTSETQRHRA